MDRLSESSILEVLDWLSSSAAMSGRMDKKNEKSYLDHRFYDYSGFAISYIMEPRA
jgi:uncharacterized protein YfbU (UPF0304 family)